MNKHPGFIMKILFIVNSKKEKHGKFNVIVNLMNNLI